VLARVADEISLFIAARFRFYVLDKVGPGQVFAETYACVPNEPMLVNVAAAENCTVLFLKTAQMKLSLFSRMA